MTDTTTPARETRAAAISGLARPLLLPDVTTFNDLFEYVRPWDHRTMSHYDGIVPRPVPAPRMIGENELGPFCSVEMTHRKGRYGLAVVARDAVVDAIAPRIVTPDDHLAFQVIEHKQTGLALVIAQHGYIIGSHWLAYIDPASIPGKEQ